MAWLLARAFQMLIIVAIHFGMALPAVAQEGENWADLQFVRNKNPRSIAREKYFFRQDGWITCRTRQQQIDAGEGCWRLSNPQPILDIELLDPELAEFLNGMLAQISDGGASRAAIRAILSGAGLQIDDLDTAIAGDNYAWNTNMGWANILQVRLAASHILYVGFYAEHQGDEDVAVDAAIVPFPGTESAPSARSPDALVFLATGEYAKCAQQALLDAGFDPRGVDGAPGPGARAALEAWANANGLPMPPFTGDFAAQICHVLTSVRVHPQAPRSLSEAIVWPVWSGSVFYNENKADVSFAMDGAAALQVSAINFRNGLRFGNQDNRDMDLPWRPAGVVLLDGRDGRDTVGDGSQTRFASDMLRLIDAMTPDTGKRSLEQMTSRTDSLRHALGADIEPRRTYRDVFWSIVDHVDGRDIVAADFSLDADRADRRIVIFMANDPNGDDDLLLYAAAPRATAPPPPPAQSGYPSISGETHLSGLVDADCDPATSPARSTSVAKHDGFAAFPVRLCLNNSPMLDIVVWAKANAAGDQLTTSMTLLDGGALPFGGGAYDETTQANVYELNFDVNGSPVACSVAKPAGGIAFDGEALCR